MPSRLLRVALTGGIATGKSTCVRRLRALGAPVIEADVLARRAVAPNTPGLRAVVDRFGSAVLDAHGHLDRAALGRIVFTDDAARRDLEAVIHPDVRQATEHWLAEQEAGGSPVAIADIPLLFEAHRERDFDTVVVAACRPDQQLARLMARDGLSESDARQRLAAQLPIDDKRRRADIVIDTSGSESETEARVDAVWKKLQSLVHGDW